MGGAKPPDFKTDELCDGGGVGPAGTDTGPRRRSEDPGQTHAEAAAAFRHGCETRRCGRRSPASKGHRGHGKEGRARPATRPAPRRPCPPTLHRTGPRAQARSAPPQPGRCTPPGGLPCPPQSPQCPPHPTPALAQAGARVSGGPQSCWGTVRPRGR